MSVDVFRNLLRESWQFIKRNMRFLARTFKMDLRKWEVKVGKEDYNRVNVVIWYDRWCIDG